MNPTRRISLRSILLGLVLAACLAAPASAETDVFGYQNVTEGGVWKGAYEVTVQWGYRGNVYWGGRIVDTRTDGHCVSAWRKYDIAYGPDSSWRRIGTACGNGTASYINLAETYYDTHGAWFQLCLRESQSVCAAPSYRQDNS